MEREYFDCTCYHENHSLIVEPFPEDGEVWIKFIPHENGFFRRVWVAIRYVLKLDGQGYYHSTGIKEKDFDRLVNAINRSREKSSNNSTTVAK